MVVPGKSLVIKDWLGSRPTSLAICCQGLRRRTKSLKGGEVWGLGWGEAGGREGEEERRVEEKGRVGRGQGQLARLHQLN